MHDQYGRPLSLWQRLKRLPKWYRFYRGHRWAVLPALRAAWHATTAY